MARSLGVEMAGSHLETAWLAICCASVTIGWLSGCRPRAARPGVSVKAGSWRRVLPTRSLARLLIAAAVAACAVRLTRTGIMRGLRLSAQQA